MKYWIPAAFIFLSPFLLQAQAPEGQAVPSVKIQECVFKKGKQYIPSKYLNILKFQENLAPVRILDTSGLSNNGKIGFVGTSAELVIPAMYDTVFRHFLKGTAVIGIDSGSGVFAKGLIDKKNTTLVPVRFKEIGERRNEFVLVEGSAGLWGFYNTILQKSSKLDYETIHFFRKEYFLVSNLGKKGVMDQTGRIVVAVLYKNILAKKDGSLELKLFNRYMVKNFGDKIVNQLECDSIMPQQKNLYKYAINGKYGIILNNQIASPVYDYISGYSKGRAFVKKNGYAGLIDTSGNVALPAIYDKVVSDTNGLYYILGVKSKQFGTYFVPEKQKTWAVLDHQLNTLVDFQYKNILPIGDSLFAVMDSQDKWGYINDSGTIVIPFKYDFAKPFKNGFADVGIREPYKKIFYFINKKGEEAVSPANYHVYKSDIGTDSAGKIVFHYPYNSFHRFSRINNSFVKVQYGYRLGVADNASDMIVSPEYDSVIYSPQQNCFIVYKEKLVGIFGAKGDTVHPLTDKYERIFPFSDGYARVIKDGKYGCIDYHKNRRISMQYDQLMDAREDMLGATIFNGKWGFLDKAEAIRVQPYYAEVRPFKKGVARVRTGQYWDFVNTEGKIVSSSLYQDIEETDTDKWILTYNGKKGMADSAGREMLVPRYQAVKDLGHGYLQVWREGKTGVLDYQQNFVLPIEHSNLTYDPINDNFIIFEPGSIEKFELANNSKQK